MKTYNITISCPAIVSASERNKQTLYWIFQSTSVKATLQRKNIKVEVVETPTQGPVFSASNISNQDIKQGIEDYIISQFMWKITAIDIPIKTADLKIIKKSNFDAIENRLPELKGMFEKTYKSLIGNSTSIITENVLDGTKEVYGYSLRTFIPEEIELFETLAEAIIRDAEKNKAVESVMFHGVHLSVVADVEYLKIKHKIVNSRLLSSAWREFYAPAIIDVGIPKLTYIDREYYLKFSFHHSQFPREVAESKDWKTHLITALKLAVTDMFFDCLDSVSGNQYSIYPDLKEFFNWRETQLNFQKITTRLPELKGMFD